MSAQPSWANVEALPTLPQSAQAEQAVLGGLMLAPASLPKVADWLKPEDFYREDHAEIYRAILAMAEARKPFDAVTLCDWFDAEAKSELVDGGAYLIELASTTPSAANIVAYAEIVSDKATRRAGIARGSELVHDLQTGKDTGQVIASHTQAMTSLRGGPAGGGLLPASAGLNDWFDDLQARYARGDAVTGLPYPWADVNKITHGMQPGELTIIAARPSMGKSVMGLNVALMNAMRGKNVAFFSLEMTTRQVNRRNIASLSGVDHDWLLAPGAGDYWGPVSEAVRQLKSASLLVDESAGLTTPQVVARVRRAHMQRPLDLIVLDHLHDMEYPEKKDMRHQIGEAVGACKKLGKECGCPVVVLAQLNRGLESRMDKRPVMSDLRESGEIEQKADVVWFLYREDYYQRNAPGYQPTHAVELILGKGRDLKAGPPVILREDFSHMALRDWDGDLPTRTVPTPKSRGIEA
jgi:replicative DNA helicase